MNAAKRYAICARTFVAGLALAAALSAAPARAEEPESKGRLTLKVGAFFPTQGTLRNQSGQPYWAVAGEWDPDFRFRLKGGRISFGADVLYRESGGVRMLTLPLTIRSKWDITQAASHRVYGGVGAGAYFISTEHRGQTLQPGLKFILGADINERWLVEMNYDWVSGFTDNVGNGIRNDGFTVLLGYKY